LAFALAGDSGRAESLESDLKHRYPLDTQMQAVWVPAIEGQLSLNRKRAPEALAALQSASAALEMGTIQFGINGSCLYPAYVRGEAYLADGKGDAAAAEFQKILDHGGLVWNCWTGALARLGVARANALQSRTSQGQGRERMPMPRGCGRGRRIRSSWRCGRTPIRMVHLEGSDGGVWEGAVKL